jgi:hypothetical protein
MRVGSSSWSLEVSKDWRVTDHPECLTLELSDHGALQVSAAHKQVGLVTDQDLLSFDERHGTWGHWQPASCGDFNGIVYEYTDGEGVWLRWFLKWGQTFLFVTYNGTSTALEEERAAIDQVLSTARAETVGEA